MVAVPMIKTDIYQRILEHMNVAVAMFDSGLRLRYINPAGEMLFGASARHMLGEHFFSLIKPVEPLLDQLNEAITSMHPFTKHEQEMELFNGQNITADFNVSIVQSSFAENEILFEIIPTDRLIKISREDALYEQQKTTRDLLRSLAHEIKNPLGGLRGAAQLLDRELTSEEHREYTRVIIDEADRLQKLVNRLLGPSGMPKTQDVNIHQLIEYVRNIVMAEDNSDITFHRDYDISIPEVQGDPDLLIQALLNIVNNAKQALGKTGNITIRTRVLRMFTIGQKKHKVVAKIDVIDDGPGIPEDIKDKIFYPMITGRAEGTGLGLSIAQRLIHQHGGLIECESKAGQTIFSIILPIES